MSGPAIGALVLAAGRSRRFGSDKRRARLADGTPVLIATLLRYAAVTDDLRVVLRPDDDELARQLAARIPGLRILRAPRSDEGMGGSLADGIASCDDLDWVLVVLGDMPFVQRETLERLLETVRDAGPEIDVIRPVRTAAEAGGPGHPVAFRSTRFAELAACSGDTGARSVVQRAQGVLQVETTDPGVLRDLDRPEAI
ncbi:MAG: nucleotidyltransferase family protein [Gammaproteobacteria bacterium]|nr:nucleotidyltransferase family protein [Gammaproteobacteria bacterium]